MRESVTVDFDHNSEDHARTSVENHHRLQSSCPVAWSDRYGGYWIVTGYEPVSTIARDDLRFSSFRSDDPDDPRKGTIIPPSPGSPFPAVPIEMDPPEFLTYRHLLNPYFAPAESAKWQPFIDGLVTACVDEVIETGEVDFVLDLANPVPAIFTMKFLGLPLDEWKRWRTPFHDVSSYRPGTPEHEAAGRGMGALIGELLELAPQRRAHPGDDLFSDLATARVDGELLPMDRVVGAVFLIVAGGVDTTTALIANALHWLGQHPAERRRLREDPGLMQRACEEFLRFFTPVQALARTAACPVALGGVEIDQGDRVLLSWAAANRDPSVFVSPDELRLDRFPNRHTAFGVGAHRCIGSNFARSVFTTLVGEVLARMPDYEVDLVASARNPSIGAVNGWVKMPATFAPSPRSGAPSLAEVIEHATGRYGTP